jgi:hypothetical protein
MHFHPGTVVVYTVQGASTYDEGWVSEAGDVLFEVAGSTHLPRMVGRDCDPGRKQRPYGLNSSLSCLRLPAERS